MKTDTEQKVYPKRTNPGAKAQQNFQTFEDGKELRRECVVWEASVAETLRSPKIAILASLTPQNFQTFWFAKDKAFSAFEAVEFVARF